MAYAGGSARFTIDHGPIRACITECGATAFDVAKATGIALPKILHLMRLSGGVRREEALTGFELVKMCFYVGLPLSAVVRFEKEEP